MPFNKKPKKAIDLLVWEPFVVACVIAYSIAIFLISSPDINPQTAWLLNLICWTLAGLFIAEYTIKLKRFGWKKFLSKGEGKFDTLIFIISIYLFIHPLTGTAEASAIYLFRVARVFKVIRLIKYIPNRDHVYEGMVRALKSSGAVFLYLFLMIYVFSIIGNFAFSDSLPDDFGTPLKSMYTTFSIFMIENWNEVPDKASALGLENAASIRAFFVIVLISGGFLGISLANAVFVDEMVIDNNQNISEKLDKIIKKIEYQELEIAELKKKIDKHKE